MTILTARTPLLAVAALALLVAGCTESPPPAGDPRPGGTTGTGNPGGTTGTGMPPVTPPAGTNTTDPGPNATDPGPGTGTGNGTEPGSPIPGGDGDLTVAVLDNTFQPAELQVRAGSSVTFENQGMALHSVTIEPPGQEGATFADEDLDPGQRMTLDFEEPGVYLLRCKYHSGGYESGQVGRITVA